jgi:hypothetical protein
MIDFPSGFLKKQLSGYLVRGAVLRTQIDFPGESHFKRLFLLNTNFVEDPVFYVLSTSRVAYYMAHINEPLIKNNIVYLEKGKTLLNLDEACVIDIRNVGEIYKEKLFENFKHKKLEYLGQVPNEILEQIDRIISRSELISPAIKKRILPGE